MSISPFLKWAGGKRQLIETISEHLPDTYNTYYEPFVGGGALFFHLQPDNAVISDLNQELINCYQTVRDYCPELINELLAHVNDKDYFYSVRKWDREEGYANRTSLEKAGRTIFINKTCFNGLYRVNSKGEFNTPFGSYKNPTIADTETLTAVSSYLKESATKILNVDFKQALESATAGDFVYLDPPYDIVSDTANFTAYNKAGFGREEHSRLKETVDELTRRGCKILLSNAATDFIYELYKDYKLIDIKAKRSINCKVTKREGASELLIKNF